MQTDRSDFGDELRDQQPDTPAHVVQPVHSVASKSPADTISETVEDNIRDALRGLQFGEIVITVRNGNVTQIDRIARKRQFKTNQRD